MPASQTQAFSHAASTVALTALILTLSVLAAESTTNTTVAPQTQEIDSYYANLIVSQFGRLGAVQGSAYNNGAIETSAFDFPAYVHDICFHPTDHDKADCEQRFGPYADLRQTLLSGKLFHILVNAALFAPTEQKIVLAVIGEVSGWQPQVSDSSSSGSGAVQAPQSSSSSSSVATNDAQAQIEDRAVAVWSECKRLYLDQDDQKLCFQRNHRLIDRTDVTVKGNVY